MKQLDLENCVEVQKEKKPDWVNSSYTPIKIGDLVRYIRIFSDAGTAENELEKEVALVIETIPSNVYESARCKVLKNDGKKITIETKWLRKIT